MQTSIFLWLLKFNSSLILIKHAFCFDFCLVLQTRPHSFSMSSNSSFLVEGSLISWYYHSFCQIVGHHCSQISSIIKWSFPIFIISSRGNKLFSRATTACNSSTGNRMVRPKVFNTLIKILETPAYPLKMMYSWRNSCAHSPARYTPQNTFLNFPSTSLFTSKGRPRGIEATQRNHCKHGNYVEQEVRFYCRENETNATGITYPTHLLICW